MILVPLPRLVLPTVRPPFFAGTNVPSMKASRKSRLPRSRKSSAKASTWHQTRELSVAGLVGG